MFDSRAILLGCAALAIVGIGGANTAGAGTELQTEIYIGQKIAPVPLTLGDRSPASVYLGSYIVNAVAGCNDCHTNPSYAQGGNPYLGQPTQINVPCYLAGGQAFGPFVSRNITPQGPWGWPAGLALSEFKAVMRSGVDPKHPGQLLQVMPWPDYQRLSGTELQAVYDYLSSIPSIAQSCQTPPT